MQDLDLITLYITFPDNKGRLTANGAERKAIIDLPEEALSQIKEIILKSLPETNSNSSSSGQDKGNNGYSGQDKTNH